MIDKNFNINSQYLLHLVFSSMNVRVFYLKISLTGPNHIRITLLQSLQKKHNYQTEKGPF